jgi:flagellar assembly factor FliW
MPIIKARLGELEYDEDSLLFFPGGIPAFEQERDFILVQQPVNAPLAFLQSATTANLCFVTLPVLAINSDYRLNLLPEDLEILGLNSSRQPAIGDEVLCLAIVDVKKGRTPTANLLAPVVVNLRTRVARQCIQDESGYSHCHALTVDAEPACW